MKPPRKEPRKRIVRKPLTEKAKEGDQPKKRRLNKRKLVNDQLKKDEAAKGKPANNKSESGRPLRKKTDDVRPKSDTPEKERSYGERLSSSRFGKDKPYRERSTSDKPWKDKVGADKKGKWTKSKYEKKEEPTSMRLNRYIANTGICSRREADELIKEGEVEVNGKIVTEMGIQIGKNDVVKYKGKQLVSEKPVYILLNKPKDFITTKADERGRRTVMELVRNAGPERIFPVGRLDKNTTGLLLLTNDGDLTKKLTHPSYQISKIYHVTLDKAVENEHLEMLQTGFELEDGFIKADKVSRVVDAPAGNEIGIELHSGKNRIVRRMMEHCGYKVLKLDRVIFATLTKKDLPRGKWRRLSPKEVSLLKTVVNQKRASRS